MNKQEFGAKISELRRLKNISQTEFAEMIDISVSALSKIERGATYPSVKILFDIISTLNYKLEDLFNI